jgi:YVTN family beta-propeller protein
LNRSNVTGRKTITLVLTVILLTGTITAFFPSSSLSMMDTFAISDNKKDNLDCNNFILNLNGIDVAAIPESLSSLLNPQSETEDADSDIDTFDNDKERFGYIEKDFAFICKNEFVVSLSPPSSSLPPPPQSPTPCNVTVDTITEVGNNLMGIAYDSNNERMYVIDSTGGGSNIYVIDTSTNRVIGNSISVGSGSDYIAYDSNNERMYVTNFVDGTVSVIDTNDNIVIDTITVGRQPLGIEYEPKKERM